MSRAFPDPAIPTAAPSYFARLALLLAVAAIVVNAPRLILVFLEAEAVPVSAGLRVGLLGLTGIATGIVLTGGGAFLAHAVARGRRFRRLLTVTWLLVLVCSGVLITPMLAAGLGREPLTEVLSGATTRWVWSAVAVLAVELVAAGSMVAFAAHRREDREQRATEDEVFKLARERNRLTGKLTQLKDTHDAERIEWLHELQRLQRLLEERSLAEDDATPPAEADEVEQGTEQPEPIPCRNRCGAKFASPAAERGHQRACPSQATSS